MFTNIMNIRIPTLLKYDFNMFISVKEVDKNKEAILFT